VPRLQVVLPKLIGLPTRDGTENRDTRETQIYIFAFMRLSKSESALMPLTPKQLKSIDSHCDRVVARRDDGGDPSLFIRVAESRIYESKPMHKALLKEVIFMRLHDLHESDTRIPKHTPWSRDYLKYEGWTYASQKYLANRVGSKDPSYVARVLRQIEKDGYLTSRSYPIKGKGFQRRKQYFAEEAFINKRIIEMGLMEDEEAPMTDKSDGGKPLGLEPTPSGDKAYPPLGLKPTATRLKPHSPVGVNPKEVGLELVPEEGKGEGLLSPPLSGSQEEELRSKEQKIKATPKSKATGVGGLGVGSSLPESKPTKNLAVYLDNEADEGAGRNRLPSSAPAPCLRCGGTNGKHVNQPGMVCPVLKAKAAAAPRAFDVEEA
jgi:hypothetical protein